MFVIGKLAETGSIIWMVLLGALVILLHSALLSSLFRSMSQSRVVGIIFFVLYTAATVVLCIFMTKYLAQTDGVARYGFLLTALACTISGIHYFSHALFFDEDDWWHWVLDTDDVFMATLGWSAGAFIVGLFLHCLAVVGIYVAIRIVIFVTEQNSY